MLFFCFLIGRKAPGVLFSLRLPMASAAIDFLGNRRAGVER